eukprot:jgi/Mesvir1/18453/Mv14307-RA.1
MQSGSFGFVLTEAPAHKQVPGTRVIVDGFRHTLAKCPVPLYFLTHYHSDHYTGITENWNRGVIHCSPITARLVSTHLLFTPRLVRALPMRQETQVDDGLTVTLIEANHCPGAAMLLFKRSTTEGTLLYLHSGDMRYADWMAHDPLLRQCKGAAALYLDTTYCNPRYQFPPQSEAVAYVATTVRNVMLAQGLLQADGAGTSKEDASTAAKLEDDADADASRKQNGGGSQRPSRRQGLRSGSSSQVVDKTVNKAVDKLEDKPANTAGEEEGPGQTQGKRTLFLISTYVIGKEKVLHAVAQACGCLIYVDQRKLEYLKCLELDYVSIFTTEPSATPVHVTSWGVLGEVWPYFRPNWKTMAEYLAEHPQFDSCVGFVPTGWSYEYKKKGISVRTQDNLAIHLVPYSEHSSFAELQAMVSLVKPVRLVPTVGVDNGPDAEKAAAGMLKHLTGLLDQTASKSAFLKGFWKKGQHPQDVTGGSSKRGGKRARDGCQLQERGVAEVGGITRMERGDMEGGDAGECDGKAPRGGAGDGQEEENGDLRGSDVICSKSKRAKGRSIDHGVKGGREMVMEEKGGGEEQPMQEQRTHQDEAAVMDTAVETGEETRGGSQESPGGDTDSTDSLGGETDGLGGGNDGLGGSTGVSMEHAEAVASLEAILGGQLTRAEASELLECCGWDVARAVARHFDGNDASGPRELGGPTAVARLDDDGAVSSAELIPGGVSEDVVVSGDASRGDEGVEGSGGSGHEERSWGHESEISPAVPASARGGHEGNARAGQNSANKSNNNPASHHSLLLAAAPASSAPGKPPSATAKANAGRKKLKAAGGGFKAVGTLASSAAGGGKAKTPSKGQQLTMHAFFSRSPNTGGGTTTAGSGQSPASASRGVMSPLGALVCGGGDDEPAQRPLGGPPALLRQPGGAGTMEGGRPVARRLQQGMRQGDVAPERTGSSQVLAGHTSAKHPGQEADASITGHACEKGNNSELEARGGDMGGTGATGVFPTDFGAGVETGGQDVVAGEGGVGVAEVQDGGLPPGRANDEIAAAPAGAGEMTAGDGPSWDDELADEEDELASVGSGDELEDDIGERAGKGGGGFVDDGDMDAFGGKGGRGAKRARKGTGGSTGANSKPAAGKGKASVPAAVQSSGEGAPSSPLLLPPQAYDPVAHAGWPVGQPAPYAALARAFELLDTDRGRLRMTNIFTNLFRSLLAMAPADVLPAVYLCTNQIAPDFMNVQLSIGGALVAAAVSEVTGVPRARLRSLYAELGDLGDVAYACKGRQKLLRPLPPLTVTDFYNTLVRISKEGGEGTVQRKKLLMQGVMRACREREIRYVVRTLLQHLRVGAVLKTILPAVTRAAVLTHAAAAPTATAAVASGPEARVPASGPSSSPRIAGFVPVPEPQMQGAVQTVMEAFATCPSLDVIIPVLIEPPPRGGVARVPALCAMRPGIPVKPMLAKPADGILSVLDEFGSSPFVCEYKYDGQRAQIHLEASGRVWVFSRNLADSTERFPDVVALVKEAVAGPGGARSFVIDAEIVGVRRTPAAPPGGYRKRATDLGEGQQSGKGEVEHRGECQENRREDGGHGHGGCWSKVEDDGLDDESDEGHDEGHDEGPGDGHDEGHKEGGVRGDFGEGVDELRSKEADGAPLGRVATQPCGSLSPENLVGKRQHKPSGGGGGGGSAHKRYYYGGEGAGGGRDSQEGTMELIPFQELSTRGRVDVALADVTVDVCVFLFDLLYLDGRSLLKETLRTRRSLMSSAFPRMRPRYFEMARCVLVQGGEGGGGGISGGGFGINALAASDKTSGREDHEGNHRDGDLNSSNSNRPHGGDVAAAASNDSLHQCRDVVVAAGSAGRVAAVGEAPAGPLTREGEHGEMRDGWEHPAQPCLKSPAAGVAGGCDGGGGGGGNAGSAGASAADTANVADISDAAGASAPEEVVRSFFQQALACGCEGLVAKALDDGASTYEPARRCSHWLKLKKDYVLDKRGLDVHGMSDSVDLVPIGAWWGNGRKAGWFSPFLCAVYDPDTEEFQSLCRVMSGFSDAFYKEATAFYKERIVPARKSYVRTGEDCAVWFEPCQVWEIRGADLTLSPVHQAAHGLVHESRGIGMRFPRFIRARPDKAPEDATTAASVAEMFRKQRGGN